MSNPIADDAPCVVDLFSGAGGLSEGFARAGYRVVAGQDRDRAAGETFAASHPTSVFRGGPVQGVAARDLLGDPGSDGYDVDVVCGGPPCQGFSYSNHGRGVHDPRAALFREYLRLAAEIRPRWLVMENVEGILGMDGGTVAAEICAGMGELGYAIGMQVLKAERYGVPQERRRTFFLASRDGGAIPFPAPTHAVPGGLPPVTIGDAISDLPPVPNGGGQASREYSSEARSDFQVAMRAGSPALTAHVATKLSAVNLARLAHIPSGGSWRDIPHEMLAPGMQRAHRSDHTKRYGRPRWIDLSCTVLTKCDPHWGAFFHPEQPRAFTVREAARLQSFPDRVSFAGGMTEAFRQIGNAVPPLLAEAVARAILATR